MFYEWSSLILKRPPPSCHSVQEQSGLHCISRTLDLHWVISSILAFNSAYYSWWQTCLVFGSLALLWNISYFDSNLLFLYKLCQCNNHVLPFETGHILCNRMWICKQYDIGAFQHMSIPSGSLILNSDYSSCFCCHLWTNCSQLILA